MHAHSSFCPACCIRQGNTVAFRPEVSVLGFGHIVDKIYM